MVRSGTLLLVVSFPVFGVQRKNRESGWGLGMSLLAGVERKGLPHHLKLEPLLL